MSCEGSNNNISSYYSVNTYDTSEWYYIVLLIYLFVFKNFIPHSNPFKWVECIIVKNLYIRE